MGTDKKITDVRHIKATDYIQNNEHFVEYKKIDLERIKRDAIDNFCSWMNEQIHDDYITFDDVLEYSKRNQT